MIPRHCALCGLVANRNTEPFVIFMTISGVNVDFMGACRVHMNALVRLINQDLDVELVAEFNAETMTRFPSAVSS